jgi:hypothetical protein
MSPAPCSKMEPYSIPHSKRKRRQLRDSQDRQLAPATSRASFSRSSPSNDWQQTRARAAGPVKADSRRRAGAIARLYRALSLGPHSAARHRRVAHATPRLCRRKCSGKKSAGGTKNVLAKRWGVRPGRMLHTPTCRAAVKDARGSRARRACP